MKGYFMDTYFTVSDRQILTPSNLSGQHGSDWAIHNMIGGKGKSQWVGAKLRTYTFDILLRLQDGVRPWDVLRHFQQAAENHKADYFIVGNRPLSENRFKITALTDSDHKILSNGVMVECKINMTIEEYV